MAIQGFDAKNPTATYLASITRYDCKINDSPLMIVVNWNSREVKLNSPLFQQQTLLLAEYDEVDGMNFEQWVSHKVELLLNGDNGHA